MSVVTSSHHRNSFQTKILPVEELMAVICLFLEAETVEQVLGGCGISRRVRKVSLSDTVWEALFTRDVDQKTQILFFQWVLDKYEQDRSDDDSSGKIQTERTPTLRDNLRNNSSSRRCLAQKDIYQIELEAIIDLLDIHKAIYPSRARVAFLKNLRGEGAEEIGGDDGSSSGPEAFVVEDDRNALPGWAPGGNGKGFQVEPATVQAAAIADGKVTDRKHQEILSKLDVEIIREVLFRGPFINEVGDNKNKVGGETMDDRGGLFRDWRQVYFDIGLCRLNLEKTHIMVSELHRLLYPSNQPCLGLLSKYLPFQKRNPLTFWHDVEKVCGGINNEKILFETLSLLVGATVGKEEVKKIFQTAFAGSAAHGFIVFPHPRRKKADEHNPYRGGKEHWDPVRKVPLKSLARLYFRLEKGPLHLRSIIGDGSEEIQLNMLATPNIAIGSCYAPLMLAGWISVPVWAWAWYRDWWDQTNTYTDFLDLNLRSITGISTATEVLAISSDSLFVTNYSAFTKVCLSIIIACSTWSALQKIRSRRLEREAFQISRKVPSFIRNMQFWSKVASRAAWPCSLFVSSHVMTQLILNSWDFTLRSLTSKLTEDGTGYSLSPVPWIKYVLERWFSVSQLTASLISRSWAMILVTAVVTGALSIFMTLRSFSAHKFGRFVRVATAPKNASMVKVTLVDNKSRSGEPTTGWNRGGSVEDHEARIDPRSETIQPDGITPLGIRVNNNNDDDRSSTVNIVSAREFVQSEDYASPNQRIRLLSDLKVEQQKLLEGRGGSDEFSFRAAFKQLLPVVLLECTSSMLATWRVVQTNNFLEGVILRGALALGTSFLIEGVPLFFG